MTTVGDADRTALKLPQPDHSVNANHSVCERISMPFAQARGMGSDRGLVPARDELGGRFDAAQP